MITPHNRWHKYFYDLTLTVASNSQCLSRQIGAIITRDNLLLSTGYNGPPRGIPRCDQRYDYDQSLAKAMQDYVKPLTLWELKDRCPRQVLGYRSGEGLQLCPATHAEANAIVAAAYAGVSIAGGTMWLSCNIPCSRCLCLIINAGIKRVVVAELKPYDSLSTYLIKHSQLEITEYV
jgi:dCMP deaminase